MGLKESNIRKVTDLKEKAAFMLKKNSAWKEFIDIGVQKSMESLKRLDVYESVKIDQDVSHVEQPIFFRNIAYLFVFYCSCIFVSSIILIIESCVV